jgi:phospholipase A1
MLPPAPPPAQPPAAPSPQPHAGKPRMPTIQRPEQPIETTAVPGEITPRAPDAGQVTAGLEYVRGIRYILSGHRENYFISGVSNEQHVVKFQYSAKFDLWPNASRHSAYFGFTQKSLWKLWDFDNSSPFEESNYAPEVFYGYYSKIGDIVPRPSTVTWFIESARAGLEHESNGADGVRSRSWNRVYAMVQAGTYFGTNHYVMAIPRAWLPPFGDKDNENIEEYLGLGALSLEYGYDPVPKAWYGGGNITATLRKGLHRDFDRRSVEIALQWRPAYEGRLLEWWKFTPFFYVQIFRGYGESLLQYDQKVNVVRVGISFEDRVNWVTLPRRMAPR